MAQQQAIHKFVLGSKEVEGKEAEFGYDKGWYSITNIVGEEREVIYRSRNAQEAYAKWNVYIGRKKERPVQEERRRSEPGEGNERRNERSDRPARSSREGWDSRREQSHRSPQGNRDNSGENRGENRGDRNYRERGKSRPVRDNARGEHREREVSGSREVRRDRRRNRGDRSRRDREYTGQE
ncbi:MAG: hypothetical protein NC180_07505 [Muribaculaceae bacterium]|nr:hypothetical protein [Roseburia sp.]MCM1429922.1 hypothetical protein [Muribaculaceae bacterium]MCM1493051.1 hypothetical protein [Muribaculaceae bacterium]